MESNFAPSKIVEKLKELNKNCVIILGSEPVVSNHIKKESLIAAPDCALGHLTRKLARKKLRTMVIAVKDL